MVLALCVFFMFIETSLGLDDVTISQLVKQIEELNQKIGIVETHNHFLRSIVNQLDTVPLNRYPTRLVVQQTQLQVIDSYKSADIANIHSLFDQKTS